MAYCTCPRVKVEGSFHCSCGDAPLEIQADPRDIKQVYFQFDALQAPQKQLLDIFFLWHIDFVLFGSLGARFRRND